MDILEEAVNGGVERLDGTADGVAEPGGGAYRLDLVFSFGFCCCC